MSLFGCKDDSLLWFIILFLLLFCNGKECEKSCEKPYEKSCEKPCADECDYRDNCCGRLR